MCRRGDPAVVAAVADNAAYRGLVYFGAGEQRLQAGRWEIRSSLGATYFTRSLASEGCVPIEAVRFIEGKCLHICTESLVA